MKRLMVFLFLVFSATSFSQPDTTIYVQVCFSYTFPSGNYTTHIPGQFYDTLTATNGTDSIIEIRLLDVVWPNQETLVFEDGDLIAPNGLMFQWIDCETGNTIIGEDERVFTPTFNGTYKASVFTPFPISTCVTDCFVLENLNVEESELFGVNLYPNPTKDIFTIQFIDNTSKTITVYNPLNEIILEKKVNKQEVAVNLENQPSGIYLVKISNEKGESSVAKVVRY